MRDNYYLLLELDPSIKEEATINAAITAKRNQWSQEINHPTKGPKFKQNLSKVEEIKAVMLNAQLREEEAGLARKEIIRIQQEKNKDLITAGSMLVKNGEISESDLKMLLGKPKFSAFKGKEDEVLKILKAKVVKQESNFKDDGIQLLDGTIMGKIRTSLIIMKKDNLFDFLGLSPTSSCSELQKRTKEKYDESSRNANKTPEVTATGALVPHCETCFKDDPAKAQYIKSNDFESLSSINDNIDLAGELGSIDEGTYQYLVEAGTQRKVKLERVEFYIHQYCQKKKIKIAPKSETGDYKKQLQCSVCFTLNEPAANNCGNCGSPLKVACPKCGNTAKSIENACIKCGFFIGNMPNAIYLIRDASVALSKGDYENAKKLIDESEIYWPGNTNGVKVKGDIAKAIEKSKSLNKELNELIAERKFMSAKSKLAELSGAGPSNAKDIAELQAQISTRIASAGAFCVKAKAETNTTKRLDLFLSALEECADLPEALLGASSVPVEAPAALKTTKSKKTIVLQWAAPASNRALKYRVLRKLNSKPTGFADGDILTETTGLTFEDFEVVAGNSYYYAVYSFRGNSFSDKAETAGPVLIVEEVTELKLVAGDATVSFNWKASRLAKRVEIFRANNGRILKYGDGVKVPFSGANSFVDSKLENDKELLYAFYLVFEDSLGKEQVSEGVIISAKPSSPPLPVKDLSYNVVNQIVSLTWGNAAKGVVRILRSQAKLPFAVGSVVAESELQQAGDFLPNQSNTSASFNIDFQGQIVLTPVTCHNNAAIIGKEVCITSMVEVKNVRGRLYGGRLYLEWDWPNACNMVKIKYSNDDFPANVSNATVIAYTQQQYRQNEAFIINQPVSKDYYFTVYTSSKIDGADILSNGVNELVVNSPVATIEYKAVVNKFLRKRAYVELKCTQKVIVPELMVVIKNAGLPLNKTDGACVVNISRQAIDGSTKIEIPFEHAAKGKYVRIFFVNDTDSKRVRLAMPAMEELELN